jgi:hypothetical protein
VALSKGLRHDIYDLRTPGVSIDEIQAPSPDPLIQLEYSCVYWVDHLFDRHSSTNKEPERGFQNGDATQGFLGQNYLRWLESLSLLSSVTKGVLSMCKLLHLLKVRIGLQDIFRFLPSNRATRTRHN